LRLGSSYPHRKGRDLGFVVAVAARKQLPAQERQGFGFWEEEMAAIF
jgi:hypothetical protein